jgi:TMEM175 potassium channel family protein
MMSKGRMEAFSDGVIAIIITIMVLQLPLPRGADLQSLKPLVPVFFTYLLSYVYIGIYWNNHHHLLQATQHVSGGILWANLNLLFWLSLIPFATAWLGAHPSASWPVAIYGCAMLFAAIAYVTLTRALVAHHGKNSLLASSIGSDRKGVISLVFYVAGIALAFTQPRAAIACYVIVAVIWFLPDRRIEKNLSTRRDTT